MEAKSGCETGCGLLVAVVRCTSCPVSSTTPDVVLYAPLELIGGRFENDFF